MKKKMFHSTTISFFCCFLVLLLSIQTKGQKTKRVNYQKPPSKNPSVSADHVCSITSEVNVATFYNTKYDFRTSGKHILYMTNKLMLIGYFRECSTGRKRCVYAVEARVNFKQSPTSQTDYPYSLFLKHVGQNNLKAVYSDFSCLVNDTELSINDPTNDLEWYNTYLAGRNTSTREHIDCYERANSQTTDFRIMFEEPNERISQTLVRIHHEMDSEWIRAVQIYPSVDALDYEIRERESELPLGLSGGLCGLTNKDDFDTDTWMLDSDGKYRQVDLTRCLASPTDKICLQFSEFWSYHNQYSKRYVYDYEWSG